MGNGLRYPGITRESSPCSAGLRNMHKKAILMHMRTTLILDEGLVQEARRLTGLREKTAIVRAGLEALIARESARRLAALGGTEPGIRHAPRRRPHARRRRTQ